MAARTRRKKVLTPQQELARLAARAEKERVIYFPVKHFSVACGWHVGRLIREVHPVAVLVEGPDDATELIPHLVHPDTRAPLTLFSSFVDHKNVMELNGILSPDPEIPARYRAWWPFTEYCPEYQALVAGAEVGAHLAFIDAPLSARLPFDHKRTRESQRVVDDRHLATSAYFEALRQRDRRRSFEEYWNATFEVGGWRADTRRFMDAVLLFAWCTRHLDDHDPEAVEAALEADGTLTRERHMKFHIKRVLRELPEGTVVVVTGAFHSVALPVGKSRKARNVGRSADCDTQLTAHSYRALSTLYSLNRQPGYGRAVWDHLVAGSTAPYDAAGMQLLVQIMRRARDRDEGVSTADAVGAWTVARNLAVLRRDVEVTPEDLVDAVQMGYVKGDVTVKGGGIEAVTRELLVGERLGRVTPEAGVVPLLRDFYDGCKTHKIDVTGASKTVRCDIHKQTKHQLKSAFLHRVDYASIPLFGRLDKLPWNARVHHFRGPDLAEGADLHLITETWAVRWSETVDDRLLELSDRGATLAEVCMVGLREELAGIAGSAADTTRLMLKSAQMMLTGLFDEMLTAVEDAVVASASFDDLVRALADFTALYAYRDALATQGHARVLETITSLFSKACLLLPSIAAADAAQAPDLLERLQTLVRISLTFEAVRLDSELLVERLHELVADPEGTPTLRGAGFGVLFSFGATREKVVARELSGYLRGSTERVLQAGQFLDGLFLSSKSIFLGSPRLLRAIHEVLAELDWATFKILLPDLRRAFSQFIPNEVDRISTRVSEEIGLSEPPDVNQPVPAGLVRAGAAADARVEERLRGWLP